jgi:polyphosphate kinase
MGRDKAHKVGDAAPREKLKGRKYLAELKALHAELVSLQEWIRHQGLKVCIVFDGRDGAGNSAMRLNPAASRPLGLRTRIRPQ